MEKDGLAATLETWSKVLQDIGSSLYLKAFADKGIAALSVVQFRYLELVARKPGITPGELARIMAVTKPTVANVLEALARKGLVEKRRMEDDGRVALLFLTDNAQEILDYRRSMYARMAKKIGSALDASERAELAHLMGKALGGMAKKEGS
jgi:DNA-binding MarR family transcriptional regulator